MSYCINTVSVARLLIEIRFTFWYLYIRVNMQRISNEISPLLPKRLMESHLLIQTFCFLFGCVSVLEQID